MLFGSSGIRQRYSAGLAELALSVGSATATSARRIAIGHDTRTTGPLIASAFAAGALSSGAEVTEGGISPTPSVAFAARAADAGAMITASHNPEPYNGMKLINPDGSAFTRAQQTSIEEKVEGYFWTGWDEQGTLATADFITPHKKALLEHMDPAEGLNMVVDCGNGAGSVITPALLSEGGVRTVCLNCNPSGHFSRPSEPLEAHLAHVGPVVRSEKAGGAIIHDGDADRFMAFDQKGRYISGEHLLMLFARWLGARQVVTTVDASMAIEEIADVRRTPVGDSFVSEKLLSWGDFGGEPSGSWIFPSHSLCPDGIYAAALFCNIASEWDVAEEIDAMPRYPIIRRSYEFHDAPALLRFMGAENPTDGIRIEEEDGWCLIRASGTEPKVRITAEGRTPGTAMEMEERGVQLLKKAKHDYTIPRN